MGLICSSNLCTSYPACPCCGFASKAMVKQELKDMMKTWMKRLTEISPETKLRHLAMMATHDSGTYSIPKSKLGSSISRTQAIDLYEQLDLGVRQIDFRYGPVGKGPQDLAVRHGPHCGASYFGEMIKVKNWVEDNPFEFLIIDARCEKKVSQQQRDFLVHFLIEKFGKVMITKKDADAWFRVNEVTLGDLSRNYPKRVLMLVDSMVTDYPSTSDPASVENLLHRDSFIRSPWHNTAAVKKLFDAIDCDASNLELNSAKHFFNHQLILTPKLSAVHLSKYCFCLDRSGIDQKQYILLQGKKVQHFLRGMANQSKQGQMNFVMMDFFNYDPTIIQYLIGLNYPQKLEVKAAVLTVAKASHDVTSQVQTLVSRDNSLWIVSPAKDLGVPFKKGQLRLDYVFSGGKLSQKIIDLGHQDQYLLNCFTHLDVTLDVSNTTADTMDDFETRKIEIFGDTEQDLNLTTNDAESISSQRLETRESLQNMCSPPLPNLNASMASKASITSIGQSSMSINA